MVAPKLLRKLERLERHEDQTDIVSLIRDTPPHEGLEHLKRLRDEQTNPLWRKRLSKVIEKCYDEEEATD